MTGKLITLEAWARATYGDCAPSIETLRRWCRDGLILPPAKKQGRCYFVSEDAAYVSHAEQRLKFREKVRGSQAA